VRTDRTYVCLDCRIRCWPVRACPGCGETRALFDLAKDPNPGARPTESRRATATGPALLTMGLTALGSTVPLFSSGALPLAEVALFFGIPLTIAGAVVTAMSRPRVRAAHAPEDERMPAWQTLGSPVVRSRAERERIVGRVEARGGEVLASPITKRPCVAWRLSGDGDHGAIDDARGMRFTVRLEGGDAIEVDATVASIDLPFEDDPGELAADGEIASWLAARGVVSPGTPHAFREARLQHGDRVEVEGAPRREARAAGYRGSEVSTVLVDRPGSPLIVRRNPPDSPAIA
jgi:hypothetical protein